MKFHVHVLSLVVLTSVSAARADEWVYDAETGFGYRSVDRGEFQRLCEGKKAIAPEGSQDRYVKPYQFTHLKGGGVIPVVKTGKGKADCYLNEVVTCKQALGPDGKWLEDDKQFEVDPFEESQGGSFRRLLAANRMWIVPENESAHARETLTVCVREAHGLPAGDGGLQKLALNDINLRVVQDYKKLLALVAKMEKAKKKELAEKKKKLEKQYTIDVVAEREATVTQTSNTESQEIAPPVTDTKEKDAEVELAKLMSDYAPQTGESMTKEEVETYVKTAKDIGVPTQSEVTEKLKAADPTFWDQVAKGIAEGLDFYRPFNPLIYYDKLFFEYEGDEVAAMNDWKAQLTDTAQIVLGLGVIVSDAMYYIQKASLGWLNLIPGVDDFGGKMRTARDEGLQKIQFFLTKEKIRLLKENQAVEYLRNREAMDQTYALMTKMLYEKAPERENSIKMLAEVIGLKVSEFKDGTGEERKQSLAYLTGFAIAIAFDPLGPTNDVAAVTRFAIQEIKMLPRLTTRMAIQFQKVVFTETKLVTALPRDFSEMLGQLRYVHRLVKAGAVSKTSWVTLLGSMGEDFPKYFQDVLAFDVRVRLKTLLQKDQKLTDIAKILETDPSQVNWADLVLNAKGNKFVEKLRGVNGKYLLSDADFFDSVLLFDEIQKLSGRTLQWDAGTQFLVMARLRILGISKLPAVEELKLLSSSPDKLAKYVRKTIEENQALTQAPRTYSLARDFQNHTPAVLENPVKSNVIFPSQTVGKTAVHRGETDPLQGINTTKIADNETVPTKDPTSIQTGEGPHNVPVQVKVDEIPGAPRSRDVLEGFATARTKEIDAIKNTKGELAQQKKIDELVKSVKKETLPVEFRNWLTAKGGPNAVDDFLKRFFCCKGGASCAVGFGQRVPASAEDGKKFATRATCSASSDAI